MLEMAKQQNKEIKKMIPEIEDSEMKKDLSEICDSVEKIIVTITEKPNKKKKASNFFDYYLPVTLKMIQKYDEIENQRLTSLEGKQFMLQAKKMIGEVNVAFKKQLSNLFESDLIDADAELKVFDAMLKADGFDGTDFDLKNKKGDD